MLSRLPLLHPALSLHFSAIPDTGKLKPVEYQIDAVLCSYIAAHWWFWGIRRNRVYGCGEKGLRRGARAQEFYHYARRKTLISTGNDGSDFSRFVSSR
jgi:hypothetical protein